MISEVYIGDSLHYYITPTERTEKKFERRVTFVYLDSAWSRHLRINIRRAQASITAGKFFFSTFLLDFRALLDCDDD